MKMKPEDFAELKRRVEAAVAAQPAILIEDYRNGGMSHMRYRWDMLWHTKSTDFVCNTLYRYLNDDHIDTALRAILGSDYPAAKP